MLFHIYGIEANTGREFPLNNAEVTTGPANLIDIPCTLLNWDADIKNYLSRHHPGLKGWRPILSHITRSSDGDYIIRQNSTNKPFLRLVSDSKVDRTAKDIVDSEGCIWVEIDDRGTTIEGALDDCYMNIDTGRIRHMDKIER
jgi:hypothetical protein